jgi:hypothetical protein
MRRACSTYEGSEKCMENFTVKTWREQMAWETWRVDRSRVGEEIVWRCGVGSTGPGQDPVLASCEQDDQPSGSIKGASFWPCERLLASLHEVTVSWTAVRVRDQVLQPDQYGVLFRSDPYVAVAPNNPIIRVDHWNTLFCWWRRKFCVLHGVNTRVRLCSVDKNTSPHGAWNVHPPSPRTHLWGRPSTWVRAYVAVSYSVTAC